MILVLRRRGLWYRAKCKRKRWKICVIKHNISKVELNGVKPNNRNSIQPTWLILGKDGKEI